MLGLSGTLALKKTFWNFKWLKKDSKFYLQKTQGHRFPIVAFWDRMRFCHELRSKTSKNTLFEPYAKNKVGINPLPYLKPLHYEITRHHRQLLLSRQFPRTNTNKCAYYPRTSSDWNSLPFDILVADDFPAALRCCLGGTSCEHCIFVSQYFATPCVLLLVLCISKS